MSDDIHIRIEGRAGRITLDRPKALNALTHAMCLSIDAALATWAGDDAVAVVVIDAAGDKAFCAGGDIAEMYATGTAGDHDYGRRFWADEYRMNAAIRGYPKPVVSLMQGFVMGGGVGVGCHGSHRVVAEDAQVAMPECGIGLVPDVGGSLILAEAPGALGAFLGLTGHRMGPGDAILAGFADHYIPRAGWPGLIAALVEAGNPAAVTDRALPPPAPDLEQHRALIDDAFGRETLAEIRAALDAAGGPFAEAAGKALDRNSPLAMACALGMLRRLRAAGPSMAGALALEYRYTARSMEHGDFLEGIRAAIIDRDRNPQWRYRALADVGEAEVARMLAPLQEELAL